MLHLLDGKKKLFSSHFELVSNGQVQGSLPTSAKREKRFSSHLVNVTINRLNGES